MLMCYLSGTVIAVVCDMDGDFEEFEEIDDDFLSSICLDSVVLNQPQKEHRHCCGNRLSSLRSSAECSCQELKDGKAKGEILTL